jgi:Uri superfamily endonuclease
MSDPKQLINEVARRAGQSVSEVGTAVAFYDAVNRVSRIAGPGARDLILGGDNPLLTPRTVRALAGRSPVDIQMAVANAECGLNPFARAVPDGTSFDTIRWKHDLDRLRRAAELLTAPGGSKNLPVEALSKKTITDAIAVRAAGGAVARALAVEMRPACGDLHDHSNRAPSPTSVAAARGLVEGVACDLPLLAAAYTPTGPQRDALAAALAEAVASADRLIPFSQADSPADSIHRPVDWPEGPLRAGGTYTVVMRSSGHPGRRIGRLGTFLLPAGYLLYVGSAFAADGVAGRTDRHRDADAPLRWNIDHLKAIARPVELWWTHNDQGQPVECPWAMALAALPGYCCPAPRCGGNDCKRCPAHLYYTADRPSCEAFVAAVRVAVANHGPVYRQRFDAGR